MSGRPVPEPPSPQDLPPGLPAVGDVFAGKYRIEGVLGIGGMGAVLAARHLHLDERVAIKVMLPQVEEDGATAMRFLREARAAVKIRSEHVAKVLDFGTLESGRSYMVMEYLEGEDLGSALDRRGRLPVQDVVDYLLQACDAVAQAHALGIVHRDIKPGNLFLARGPDGGTCLKVLDFGISKALRPAGGLENMALTNTQSVLGSPYYMAPEQMRSSGNVDARTDIWALGVVAYELLSGGAPFAAQAMPELCAMILQDAPASLRERRPDVPAGLEAAVLKCLEKAPRSRFEDLAALATAIAPFGPPNAGELAARVSRTLLARVEDTGVSSSNLAQTISRPIVGELGPTLDARTAQTWSGALQSAQRSRAPLRIAAVAVVVVAAGLGAGLLLFRHPSVPESASVPPASAPPAPAVAPSTTQDPSHQPPSTAGAEPAASAPPDAGVIVTPKTPPKPAVKPTPPRPPPHPPATPKPQPSSVDPNGRAGTRFD
jgi:serine/threonine protein kinase